MKELPKSLQSFFSEQRARYGELFWFQEQDGKIILMIEKLAEKAREILIKENIKDAVEVISFDAADAVGEFYLVEAEQIDVETRPSKQEYKSIMDKDLKTAFTDLTNDIYKDQLVRIFQPQDYSSFCVVVYHSFGLQAPRGPIGWIKNLEGLRKLTSLRVDELLKSQKENLISLEEVCKKLEGVKYQMGGGSNKNGFDCSALVQRVFYETKGVWLPRKARWQQLVCEPVKLNDLKQSDLVFFNKKSDENKTIEHVGLISEVQTGKLPMIFHATKSTGKALFEDLNKAEWLFSAMNPGGTREIAGFGRVKSIKVDLS